MKRTNTTTSLVRGMAMRFAWQDTPLREPEAQPASDTDPDTPDPQSSLLLEVDFKWLMAGHGWWVDTTRFREDAAYAASCLASAKGVPSATLRQCAATLQARMARARAAAATRPLTAQAG